MKYQKLKRNLYTACVVANLFLIPSPVLWAEQSMRSLRVCHWNYPTQRSVMFLHLLRKIVNIVSFILTQFVRNYTGMSM